MQPPIIALIVILAVAVLVLAAVVIWFTAQRRRSAELHEHFGPEYERTVNRTGDRGKAEKDLHERQERAKELDIRPLSEPERARFTENWGSIQAQFVDDPGKAIREADRLVAVVMETRGYPVGQFDQAADYISVDHPNLVEGYRAAHAIAGQQQRGEATTDDLRRGLLHYRALFDELLDSSAVGRTEPAIASESRR